MDADVFVQVCGVVQRYAFETLKTCSKLVELGKAAATLLLDANFDLPYPATLKLDALSNYLLL